MQRDASGEYLKNTVLTAAPEQLQLMLIDGAIRFSRQAHGALTANRLDEACEKLIRAQRIITELRGGLRPQINPELCNQMAGLYDFIFNRLVDAGLHRIPSHIEEALRILEHQRETWLLLIEKVRTLRSEQNPTPPVQTGAPPTTPSRRPEAPTTVGGALSIEG